MALADELFLTALDGDITVYHIMHHRDRARDVWVSFCRLYNIESEPVSPPLTAEPRRLCPVCALAYEIEENVENPEIDAYGGGLSIAVGIMAERDGDRDRAVKALGEGIDRLIPWDTFFERLGMRGNDGEESVDPDEIEVPDITDINSEDDT